MEHFRFTARVEALVAAPAEAVWAALATSEGFAQIYPGLTVESTWQVGAPVVWSGIWEGKAFRDEGTITAFDRPHRFDYTYWTSFWGPHPTPETIQPISNTFDAVAGGTRVTITQGNLATEADRDRATKSWQDILDRLAATLGA